MRSCEAGKDLGRDPFPSWPHSQEFFIEEEQAVLHKDLLSLENLSRNEIEGLLRLALDLKLRLTVGEKLSHLTGQRLVLLFYEPRNRTRVSFAQAAYLGGAEVISVTPTPAA